MSGSAGYTAPYNSQTTPNEPGDAGSFTINVKRLTTNISADLPYVVFGAENWYSNYSDFLGPVLPAGVTLQTRFGVLPSGTGDAASDPRTVELVYTDSLSNIDIIVLSCSTVGYPSFVQANYNTKFYIKNTRLTVSDVSVAPEQFALPFGKSTVTLLGAKMTNNLTPSQYVKPDQFQSGIVDITEEMMIDSRGAVVGSIVQQANFNISHNFFVSFQERSQ